MITISIYLPKKYRLSVNFAKRRGTSNSNSIIPNLEQVRRVKSGSKISRYFRHIFEYKKIKRILGANITLAILAFNFIPSQSTAFDQDETSENIVIQSEVILSTEKATRYPVNEISITQGYRFYHPGIDLDGITGDPIYPIMKGVVTAIDYSKYAYGNAILIDHGNGLTSLYAHLSKIEVEADQFVPASLEIGKMGASGNAHGDHLHFEVRKNGLPVNPLSVLPEIEK